MDSFETIRWDAHVSDQIIKVSSRYCPHACFLPLLSEKTENRSWLLNYLCEFLCCGDVEDISMVLAVVRIRSISGKGEVRFQGNRFAKKVI